VIKKPSGILSRSIPEMAEEICRKVRTVSQANLKNLECMSDSELWSSGKSNGKKKIPTEKTFPVRNVLAIGASTGGPRALEKLIGALPAEIPAAVLVVQHMPPGFTTSFSKRLDAKSSLRVKEAQEGDKVEEGTVLIAPGNYHMEIVRKKIDGLEEEAVHLSCGPKELGSRPSVNVLFRSVAPIYGSRVISLILTGMNRDGANGAEEIKRMGGRVIAEAQTSCVVYGMPGEIVKRNLADLVLPIDRMAEEIIRIIG
jgi:two-component system chemotaxis response regulator CheB